MAPLRLEFLKRFNAGSTHIITRQNLFSDMVGLYNSSPAVVREHQLKIKFTQERSIDAGGVGREAFSGFWEAVYWMELLFLCQLCITKLMQMLSNFRKDNLVWTPNLWLPSSKSCISSDSCSFTWSPCHHTRQYHCGILY